MNMIACLLDPCSFLVTYAVQICYFITPLLALKIEISKYCLLTSLHGYILYNYPSVFIIGTSFSVAPLCVCFALFNKCSEAC